MVADLLTEPSQVSRSSREDEQEWLAIVRSSVQASSASISSVCCSLRESDELPTDVRSLASGWEPSVTFDDGSGHRTNEELLVDPQPPSLLDGGSMNGSAFINNGEGPGWVIRLVSDAG
jgi:hypothetical protein